MTVKTSRMLYGTCRTGPFVRVRVRNQLILLQKLNIKPYLNER